MDRRAKTQSEIVKEAIKRAASQGVGGDLKDVIVFLEDEIEKYRDKIQTLETCYKIANTERDEEREERMKVTKALQDSIRAERAEKEIRETRTMTMYEAENSIYRDGETVITINKPAGKILSVSVLFADEREEDEEDGEN